MGECWREWGQWTEGDKGEKRKWDNCNRIINKIHLKKEKKLMCDGSSKCGSTFSNSSRQNSAWNDLTQRKVLDMVQLQKSGLQSESIVAQE